MALRCFELSSTQLSADDAKAHNVCLYNVLRVNGSQGSDHAAAAVTDAGTGAVDTPSPHEGQPGTCTSGKRKRKVNKPKMQRLDEEARRMVAPPAYGGPDGDGDVAPTTETLDDGHDDDRGTPACAADGAGLPDAIVVALTRPGYAAAGEQARAFPLNLTENGRRSTEN